MERTILVVDDDRMVRAAMARLLRRDFKVIEASSGAGARDAIASDPPDALLCDLQLGDESGMSLFTWLQSDHESLAARCLFLTGGAVTAEAESFLSANADRVLTKPPDPMELLERLESMLQSE